MPWATPGSADRRAASGLLAPVMWVAGLIATMVAMAVGAVLAIITADEAVTLGGIEPLDGPNKTI